MMSLHCGYLSQMPAENRTVRRTEPMRWMPQNYADAITALAKVWCRMDAAYNGGEALFRLAQAYLGQRRQ